MAALIAFALAACSGSGGGGGGGPGDDLPGAVTVEVDISLLVGSGLEPVAAIGGSVQCPGGSSLPMEIDDASATATCVDLDPGDAQFTVRFDYQNGGSPVLLAQAVRSFEVVSGQTGTLAFALTAADLADDNDDGVSNLNDLLLLQDLGANAFLSGLTLACADPGLPSCHNLTLIVPAGQAVPAPGFLAGAAVSGLTDYTSTQSAPVEAITVTPTAIGPGATITVNDNDVTSGAASGPIPLNIDETVITIVVTSADGLAAVTYQIFVSSLAQFDADLTALSLSAGTLTPVFTRDTIAYTATVDFDVESVTVTATTSQPAATLQINATPAISGVASDPQPLGIGANPIEVVVTAPDAATTRKYTVTVTRAGSADLAALTVTGITEDLQQVALSLDPAFQPATFNYLSDAENRFVAATVTATALAEGAVIVIDGVAGVSRTLDLVVGSNPVAIAVSHPVGGPPDRDYLIDITRQEPPAYVAEAYLKPSIAGAGLALGTAVALSADGDEVHGMTVAVGAPEEGDGVGAVYVYTRDHDGLWRDEVHRLVPPDSNSRYNFGRSVALSADGNLLAVGAPGWDFIREFEDEETLSSGAVHLFTRDPGGAWTAQARVEAFNAEIEDGFGYSVALSGPGDSLAVGAPGEANSQGGIHHAPGTPEVDQEAARSGAVYVFAHNPGGDPPWTLSAYLKPPDPTDFFDNGTVSEWYGWSVALSGDEALLRLAVGRPGDRHAGPGASGSVHVYERAGAIWSESQPRLVALNFTPNLEFGWRVGLSVDGNTLAIGEPRQRSHTQGVFNAADGADQLTNGQTGQGPLFNESGAVHVYRRESGSWIGEAFIKASVSRIPFQFGSGVALSADGNRLVVGALGENSAATTVDGNQLSTGAPGSGAVYTFAREGQRWTETAYVKVPNSRAGIGFGTSVAMTADGDLFAGGAPGESSAASGVIFNADPYPTDNTAPNRGAAWIFRLQGN